MWPGCLFRASNSCLMLTNVVYYCCLNTIFIYNNTDGMFLYSPFNPGIFWGGVRQDITPATFFGFQKGWGVLRMPQFSREIFLEG